MESGGNIPMLVPHHLNPPPPPYFGKKIYPLSRVLVTIGNCKKTLPFLSFLGEIFPRLYARKYSLSQENGNTHAPPLYAFEWGGGWGGVGVTKYTRLSKSNYISQNPPLICSHIYMKNMKMTT